MRVGHGYDVHAFGEGEALILGGVSLFPLRGPSLLIQMGTF